MSSYCLRRPWINNSYRPNCCGRNDITTSFHVCPLMTIINGHFYYKKFSVNTHCSILIQLRGEKEKRDRKGVRKGVKYLFLKRSQVPFLGLPLGFKVELSPNFSAISITQKSFPKGHPL